MNRLLGQTLLVVAVGALAVAFTPSCAENDQTIFVRNAIAPPQDRQNGCVYTDDPTQTFRPIGTLDVALAQEHRSVFLVGSQLIPRADAKSTRIESNRVHLNGAVVRVTDANGGQLNEFTTLSSAMVDPQNNNQPSFTPLVITTLDGKSVSGLIPQVADPRRRVLVIANVKVFGRTLGGVDVETGEFQYPIEVCNGCLISFETGDDPAVQGTDCSLPLPETGGGGGAGPCNLGVDEVVECQRCKDDVAACRAPLIPPNP